MKFFHRPILANNRHIKIDESLVPMFLLAASIPLIIIGFASNLTDDNRSAVGGALLMGMFFFACHCVTVAMHIWRICDWFTVVLVPAIICVICFVALVLLKLHIQNLFSPLALLAHIIFCIVLIYGGIKIIQRLNKNYVKAVIRAKIAFKDGYGSDEPVHDYDNR